MENEAGKGRERETARRITCICCPMGCELTAAVNFRGEARVTGNRCPRGQEYGKREMLCPVRTVSTTVRIAGRENEVLPVKTASDIPKDKITECMNELAKVAVSLPVEAGDVVLENAAGTGVCVVATRSKGL